MRKKILAVLAVMVFFLVQASFSVPNVKNIVQQKGEAGILNLIPDLTEAQQQQIKILLKEEMEKIAAVRKEYRQKIEKVLTPEQLKAMQEKISSRMAEKRVSMLDKLLNLTAEQKQKIEAIYKKYMGQAGKTEGKENKIGILKKINEEIKAVLTDEQRQKFEKMMKKAFKFKGNKGWNLNCCYSRQLEALICCKKLSGK